MTYGNYANEQAQKNLDEYNQLDNKEKLKYPKPQKYAVKFLGTMENTEEDGN